jgi:hypothetical protein
MEEALLAIIARIDGVWDDQHLQSFGALLPDTLADVKRLAQASLDLEQWIMDQRAENPDYDDQGNLLPGVDH